MFIAMNGIPVRSSLSGQLVALEKMTAGELVERYREVFGVPTRARNKAFLRKRVAWRIQELAEGGLSSRALAKIEELVMFAPMYEMRRPLRRALVVRRPARVAVMLALAHKIQDAIDRGVVRDLAAVARRFSLTRARITQIMDLTLLAPDLQEQILFAEAVDGIEPMTERHLRDMMAHGFWSDQRNRKFKD